MSEENAEHTPCVIYLCKEKAVVSICFKVDTVEEEQIDDEDYTLEANYCHEHGLYIASFLATAFDVLHQNFSKINAVYYDAVGKEDKNEGEKKESEKESERTNTTNVLDEKNYTTKFATPDLTMGLDS